MSKPTENRAFAVANGFLTDRYAKLRPDLNGGINTLRWWNDTFYHYKDGRYYELPDRLIKSQIAAYSVSEGISLSRAELSMVLIHLHSMTGIDAPGIGLNCWLDGPRGADVVSCENGNISFVDFDVDGHHRLLPHTPSYFTVSRLPFDYDPEAKCPDWLSFLNAVMLERADYIRLLQQWCGYLFRPDLREQKFLLCVGEGANGKGVFFDVVRSLVGPENCSQVPLCQFHQRFAMYHTLGKTVNISNESSHVIDHEAENTLKTVVAGDCYSFERKFKDPISAIPTAKVMIATNSRPRFNDKTMGMWRRILLIPFDKVIAEADQVKGLADILKGELPGILNWALAGLKDLDSNRGFVIPESHTEGIERYRRDSDPCRAFLLENYMTATNGDGIPCGDLYQDYQSYCNDNGCRTMNSRTFGQQVRRIFPDVERTRARNEDQRFYVYRGLVPM